MKKIGIELSSIYNNKIDGIPVFVKNLVNNILASDKDNEYYQCYKLSRLKKFWTLYPTNKNFKRIVYGKKFKIFLKKLDVFHGTAEQIPLDLKNVKKIITIHDLRGLKNKEITNNKYKITYKAIQGEADHIVTDSEFIKKELLENFIELDSKKISVIHLSYDTNFSIINNSTNKKNILFVSTIAKNKNVINLLKAFHKIYKIIYPNKLILCGQNAEDDYLKLINDYIDNHNLQRNVEFIRDADFNKLLQLYNSSLMFAFPSLYEGFGIPILEAQACGCPVICSNAASLPEIGGDGAHYFNPENTEEIAKKILTVFKEQTVRKNLIQKGLNNIKRFSWGKTAQKYIQIYTNF